MSVKISPDPDRRSLKAFPDFKVMIADASTVACLWLTEEGKRGWERVSANYVWYSSNAELDEVVQEQERELLNHLKSLCRARNLWNRDHSMRGL